MSLSQALSLARIELAGLSGKARLRRFGHIVRLFASEVAGTVQLAPFAAKAWQLHSQLRPPSHPGSADDEVHLVKSIYYGTRPRNTLDLYLPRQARTQAQGGADSSSSGGGLPVVLFVHGGVWAAGESWHYAPLAASLARLGVITCVMQYTLYPDALVPQLVQEVAAAFDWTLANVGSYGGDASKVSLVGHSAGAQLCMMALLQRAQAAHMAAHMAAAAAAAATTTATTAAAAAAASSNGNGPQPSQHVQGQQPQPQHLHLQMPAQFVGVTGVYDIAKHYAYEKDRGVHSLSTMLPAMGGFQHFAANSPSVILGAALQQQQEPLEQAAPGSYTEQQEQQQEQQEGSGGQLGQELPACDFYNSFSLSGESIAHRIGFDRGSDHYLASEAGLMLQSLAGMSAVPRFDLEAAAHLPPTVLMSSCTDLTVPWYESAELYWRLFDASVPVKHLVFNKVGHGEFVTDWPGSFTPGPTQDSSSASSSSSSVAHRLQQLPPYCRDLAVVVMGQPPVNFVHKSNVAASTSTSSSRKGADSTAASRQGVRQLDAVTATAGPNTKGKVPSEWN